MVVKKCVNQKLADITDQQENDEWNLNKGKPSMWRNFGERCARQQPRDKCGNQTAYDQIA